MLNVLLSLVLLINSDLPIIVRPTELDANGHVNNGKTQDYLEWGRRDFLNSVGLTRKVLLERKCVPLVRKIEIDYRGPANLEDNLVITTFVSSIVNPTRYYIYQEIKKDGKIITTAKTLMVNVDPDSPGKSKIIPNDILKKLQTYPLWMWSIH